MPTLTTTSIQQRPPMVGMGQIMLVRSPDIISSVLGSCIGVCLHHGPSGVGALAHVVLPARQERPGPPGKFADTAVPAMLEMLTKAQVPTHKLTARIAGGASMFAGGGPLQVGEQNAAAVIESLKSARIRLVGSHLGGTKGRRVLLHGETGQIIVEIVGQEPVIL